MSISDFGRYALGFCAAFAMLAGCGSQSPLAPSAPLPTNAQSRPDHLSENSAGTTSAMQGSTIVVHPNYGRSWMDPDAKTKDLLYVTNAGD
jgi:hypothetical protein